MATTSHKTILLLSYYYLMMMLCFSSTRVKGFSGLAWHANHRLSSSYSSCSSRRFLSSTLSGSPNNNTTTTDRRQEKEDILQPTPPWSNTDFLAQKRKKRNNELRLRQHVNPLARRFQQPTILSEHWPKDVFETFWNNDDDTVKPLHLDIGCGKGGFLLRLASERPLEYNYLGLEIRPLAVQFAQDRLNNSNKYKDTCPGHLDFVGCNANVDLERLLALYRSAVMASAPTTTASMECTPLSMVTIQFPDPHFKNSHAKRRVVTTELVQTLPQFMPMGARVFLQSDVKSVLDDMRERFREDAPLHFQDQVESLEEYYPDNIIGIPTERETSVLKQDLPVYRALFVRTDASPPPATAPQSTE